MIWRVNAMFNNPIPNSYITSVFGYRVHPVTGKKESFHQGVDLTIQPNTNVKIVAAADGEVIRVGELGTYGNVVMIKHVINGIRMDTNCAHLKDKSITVKVGDKVKQGDVIGIMGTTGSSTAPHLHFEIHNGAWESGQPNALDPAKYIKFYTKLEVAKMEKRIEELENEIKAVNGKLLGLIDAVKKAAVYTSSEKASLYAEGSLKWAKDLGLLIGDTEGNLNPHGALTRQDFTVVLQRYHDKMTK